MTSHPRSGSGRQKRRLGLAVTGAAALGLWLVPAPSRAATTPTTYVIGVDHANPAGQNFEYNDFFPRTGINVHNGDILDFKIPAGATSDAGHIVGLLKQGQSVSQAFADPANALIVPDSDESAPPLRNNRIFGPSSPPPGSGAPGACGDQQTPCAYAGTAQISSGQIGPPADYFVKLALPTGFTGAVAVVDFNHPLSQPSATINVVADNQAASAQSDLDSAGASQAQSDTSGAVAAESAANKDVVTNNPDGTHTHSVDAGTATQYVEVMSMLPSTIKIARGDKVTWTAAGTTEPHTVSFPNAQSFPVSPFVGQPQCEGASADTNSPQTAETASPPDFGCPAGATPELPFLTGPQGTATIQSPSYRLVASDGGIFDFGQSAFHGSTGNLRLVSPIVATIGTGDQNGYYEAAADGGVFTFGDARYFGSMGGKKLSAPIVGISADPLNGGYLLFGADGKIYGFGPDVPPLDTSSIPAHLATPIVGAGASNNPNGPPGFWLASAGGGVFGIDGAPYLGSMGGKHLNAPIVGFGATPDGGGYWLVARDGGIFSFGDAAFHGSTGNLRLNAPIVGMVPTPTGRGYWLVARDGGVFSFGDATFHGSTGGMRLNRPVVGIDGTFSLGSSGVLLKVPAGNPNAVPSRTTYTFTFPNPGDYDFVCAFHGMMTGTVLVS